MRAPGRARLALEDLLGLGVDVLTFLRALVPSMGSIGDCYDNAVIESFWSRLQVEFLDRQRWQTRVELANALFEYLEIFHNRSGRKF